MRSALVCGIYANDSHAQRTQIETTADNRNRDTERFGLRERPKSTPITSTTRYAKNDIVHIAPTAHLCAGSVTPHVETTVEK